MLKPNPTRAIVQPTRAPGTIVFALLTALFSLGWFWAGCKILFGQQFPLIGKLPLTDSLLLGGIAFTLFAICLATSIGLALKSLWAYRMIMWLAASSLFGGIFVVTIITLFLMDYKNSLGWPAILLGISIGAAVICFPLCYLAYFFRERIGQYFGSF